MEARRLEARPADDAEVIGFWRKAATALEDDRNASSSLDNRFLRAYDAGRIAALAIVRSAGYRTRGGESHHYVTFDVARSLVADAALRKALDEMNGIRTLRHAVEYESGDEMDEGTVATAVRVAERVAALGAAHLEAERPGLRGGLGRPDAR